MNGIIDTMLNAATEAAKAKHDYAVSVYGLTCEVETARAALELREAALMAEITAETNGDGKPKYSNETARKAELAVRCAADEQFEGLAADLDDARAKHAATQVERDYRHDLHRAYTAALHAMGNG